MPKNKEASIRYRIIDKCLRNKQKPYPSLTEIVEVCQEVLGKNFSESTIQKDIYSMRFDEGLGYNAPIGYNKIHKGYYYEDENYTIASVPLNDEELQAIQFAASVLDQFKGVEMLEQFSHAINKITEAVSLGKSLGSNRNFIQVEQAPFFKGSEWLTVIANAIGNSECLKISYLPFDNDKAREYIYHPYLLKEYRNRWYVSGDDDHAGMIRTFGLDRVEKIERADVEYKYAEFKPAIYFSHTIGITVGDLDPREVVLSFTPLQGKYIKTQPLHSSQKVLIDDDKEFRIKLDVLINYELLMLILSYGKEVKVIKPESLRTEIKQLLEQTLKNYNNGSH
ncbi:MAG: helix-turn-helix transcriptional regulator [Bacteroidia bacterium]